MSTGYAGQYGNQYGQNGYQNSGYATGDLSFRCNVDYRGAVTDIRIERNGELSPLLGRLKLAAARRSGRAASPLPKSDSWDENAPEYSSRRAHILIWVVDRSSFCGANGPPHVGRSIGTYASSGPPNAAGSRRARPIPARATCCSRWPWKAKWTSTASRPSAPNGTSRRAKLDQPSPTCSPSHALTGLPPPLPVRSP